MKIAIIGAGHVGGALATGWSRKGHQILLGVRDANEPHVRSLCDTTHASALRPAEAAAAGEVVVLSLPWTAAQAGVEALGPLAGKIVIDCMNALQVKEGMFSLERGFTTSAGETVAGWIPEARLVKTLNQVGADNMVDTQGFAAPPLMFMASDDDAAKTVVAGLLADLGFEALDAGGLVQARLLEPLAMLWINQSFQRGKGTQWAFAALPKRTVH
jgi:predicted dinucleotide-binding enzyme